MNDIASIRKMRSLSSLIALVPGASFGAASDSSASARIADFDFVGNLKVYQRCAIAIRSDTWQFASVA
jgi:hypothetical protein